MGKSPCIEGDQGLKRGPWTPEEDQKLLAYVQQHGHGSWRVLPKKAGLQRCGKSCRLRWINYLRPDIKRGKFSLDEERTIIQLHALLGNRWSAIATHMPKRTDNEIKNYWNTHLKKRLAMMGIDPVTHKPSHETLGSANADPKDVSNLSHIAQWERTRLEAEARLVRESKVIKSGLASQDEPVVLSPEQILKKMPTTFGPPRWQARLFTNCLLRGDVGAPVFGSDCLKFDGSQAVPAGRSMNGFDGQIADFDEVGDWNVELDHMRFGHNEDGSVMEASVELSEVNKNSSYWNDILHLVINCEPSDLPVF